MKILGVRVVLGRSYGNQPYERIVSAMVDRKGYDREYYLKNREFISQRKKEKHKQRER